MRVCRVCVWLGVRVPLVVGRLSLSLPSLRHSRLCILSLAFSLSLTHSLSLALALSLSGGRDRSESDRPDVGRRDEARLPHGRIGERGSGVCVCVYACVSGA